MCKSFVTKALNSNYEYKFQLKPEEANKATNLEDNEFSILYSKVKGRRHTYQEKMLIVLFYLRKHWSASKIANQFYLSESSVNRIIYNYHKFGKRSFGKQGNYVKGIEANSKVYNLIKEYWNQKTTWFTVRDLFNYLKFSAGIIIEEDVLRRHLKEKLAMSYKKVSPRPYELNQENHKLIKSAYWVEFANLITQKNLWINIDEVSFSYLTKFNRSWAPKGKSSWVTNMNFKGSKSWIGAITNTGKLLISGISKTNNSTNFAKYISQLKRWIELDLNKDANDTLILLDNCPIHKSKLSIEKLRNIRATIVFILAYTPEFAPIELFFNTLKKHLTRQWRNQIVKLSSKEGTRNIREAVAAISQSEIISYWAHAIKQIRMHLLS